MSSEEIESSFNDVLFYLQLCLGLWQFIKLTPVGALIKGGIGWLLRPLGLSRIYSLLQECPGRVFKKANCFVLQADIPAERREIESERRDTERRDIESERRDTESVESERRDIESDQVNSLNLEYLGETFGLEREGGNNIMSFVGQGNKEIKYYITDKIWKELQNLEKVLSYGRDGPPVAQAAVTRAAAEREEANAIDQEINVQRLKDEAQSIETRTQRLKAEAQSIETRIQLIETDGIDALCHSADYGVPVEAATNVRAAADNSPLSAAGRAELADAQSELTKARSTAAAGRIELADARDELTKAQSTAAAAARAFAARSTAFAARAAAYLVAEAAANRTALFVKGHREFWKEIITGGVMTLEEVVDEIILYKQHVSVQRLGNDLFLLPINLSVSEEKLLKILNLVALFLQSKKVIKVHWSIPFSMSCISALLEFTTTIRVWLYSKINMLFCYIMHLICDPLPRSWRRQIYYLGYWVENLTPSNNIQLKVVRGTMCAIITEGAKIAEGAKVDKEGAKEVACLGLPLTPLYGVIEQQFPCDPIDRDIRCTFVIEHKLCKIFVRSSHLFYVKCYDLDEFNKIITLVSCIAKNGCGSLICYGPNNKVRVRSFEETVTSYVNSGFPSIYTLNLENVIVD